MFHSRPEGTGDFSPTWSEAECGVSGMWGLDGYNPIKP
ncbi:hypothetical protein Barb6_03503 [Bacteroidales bacterium Barb6]|nr:hypothetical protein Barb6_03503 [Bacteroidales bacterium Barb6]